MNVVGLMWIFFSVIGIFLSLIGIFFDRLNPTEKEKDRCEYELELAHLALAKGAKGDR